MWLVDGRGQEDMGPGVCGQSGHHLEFSLGAVWKGAGRETFHLNSETTVYCFTPKSLFTAVEQHTTTVRISKSIQISQQSLHLYDITESGAWSVVPLQGRWTHLSSSCNHASLALKSALAPVSVIVGMLSCSCGLYSNRVCDSNKECWKALRCGPVCRVFTTT